MLNNIKKNMNMRKNEKTMNGGNMELKNLP